MSASRHTPRKGTSRGPARRIAQAETRWTEIPIFIHGISPERYPATSRREYHQLLERIGRVLEQRKKVGFARDKIFITWGTTTVPPQTHRNDQYLAEVERKIESQVKENMQAAYGGPFALYRPIRDILFYGVSDLIYYISADGERALRNHIFKYVARNIEKLDSDLSGHFSLTLFGHSAGSVIAHDLLFHLFSNRRHSGSEESDVYSEMSKLRKMIKENRLRIRRLYTFGSPISPLMLRADSLVMKFRAGELLDIEDIGLRKEDQLSNPRWMNFWSRNDLISYPVELLYSNPAGTIQDREIRASLNPMAAHLGYWKSDQMAEAIGSSF